VAAFAHAARSETLGWVLFPIAIATALLWITQHVVHADRLILLALGTAAALSGVNMLRGAAHTATDRSLGTLFAQSNYARLGVGLFALGALLGYLAARHVSGGLFALGVLGLALAALYALVPSFLGAVPGEELLPAAALGPILFFFALATQLAPTAATKLVITKGHHAVSVPVVVPSVTSIPGAWSIGLALGAFVLAALLANRLGHPTRAAGQGTLSMVSAATMRLLFLVSLVAPYAIVVLAGLRHGGIHAVLAVLLSVPVAVLPLTSVLRANARPALAVLLPQTRRALLWFSTWLLLGLVLGGIYLRALTVLHTVLAK